MVWRAAIVLLLLGSCAAQLSTRFGSRSFSSAQGSIGSRQGFSSQGSGIGSQRTIQLSGRRSFTGTAPQRTSFPSTGTNVGSSFGRRTVPMQRPVATQQQTQVQPSTRHQSVQPDSVIFTRQIGPVASQTQTVQRAVAPAQTAPPVQQPVQQPAAAAPAPQTVPAAPAMPGAMPGSFMGMNPMAPMMNPMMSQMMNPMGMMSTMGMMSPMGMNPMGMMGGFPMSYDTMEDLYLDPDRPDPMRVIPPVGGMVPGPAAMPMPVAAPARPGTAHVQTVASSGTGAASGVDQSVIASALQTALSRIGQRQTITG